MCNKPNTLHHAYPILFPIMASHTVENCSSLSILYGMRCERARNVTRARSSVLGTLVQLSSNGGPPTDGRDKAFPDGGRGFLLLHHILIGDDEYHETSMMHRLVWYVPFLGIYCTLEAGTPVLKLHVIPPKLHARIDAKNICRFRTGGLAVSS